MKPRAKICCDKCNDEFSINNIKKHTKTCDGSRSYFKRKLTNDLFYKKSKYIDNTQFWEDVQKYYDEDHTVKQCLEQFKTTFVTISKVVKLGKLKLRNLHDRRLLRIKHGNLFLTDQQKQNLSKKSKENNSGGYKEHAGRSKKYKVNDSFGNLCLLQSSYEMEFASLLNELKIQWIRPKHLVYENKKYFPDFYIPSHNIYFDTKNDYLYKIDSLKIEKVRLTGVNLIVVRKFEITIEFIKQCLNIQ